MKTDLPFAEDLGEITSHRIFLTAVVWAALIGVACIVSLVESASEILAGQAPAASAVASAKPVR
jgi:hypothetical protein